HAEQEGRDALLRREVSRQYLPDVNVLGQQAEHLPLQAGDLRGKIRALFIRHAADRRGVQRHRIALMPGGINGVDSDELAREMETEHLLAAGAVDDVGRSEEHTSELQSREK